MDRLSKLAFHPVTLLLLTVLACHALLPFTDYRVQGDLWLMNWVKQKHFDYLNIIYSETGRSITGYYFGLFSGLPDMTATLKLVGFLLCAATGLLVYAIAVRTRYATRLEALFLAVVAVTFPADKLIGGLMYSKSQVCTFAFLLGALAMLTAERLSGLRHSGASPGRAAPVRLLVHAGIAPDVSGRFRLAPGAAPPAPAGAAVVSHPVGLLPPPRRPSAVAVRVLDRPVYAQPPARPLLPSLPPLRPARSFLLRRPPEPTRRLLHSAVGAARPVRPDLILFGVAMDPSSLRRAGHGRGRRGRRPARPRVGRNGRPRRAQRRPGRPG